MKTYPSQRKRETPIPSPEESPSLLRSMILDPPKLETPVPCPPSPIAEESPSLLRFDPPKLETPVPSQPSTIGEEPPSLLMSMVMEVLNKRRKLEESSSKIEESSSSNLKESPSIIPKYDPVEILKDIGNIPYSGIRAIKSCQFKAKVGLHCYNFHMETNLQFLAVTSISSSVVLYSHYDIGLDVFDPVKNAISKIKTYVWDAPRKADLTLISRSYALERSNECGCFWDPDGVDVLYTGDMPEWLDDRVLVDKLHYYELNESDLLENHDWLHLYAEVGAYANWKFKMFDRLPVKVKKAVVQTKEDGGSSSKLKSVNAIFYLTFESDGGVESKCIIRRTSDGKPQHMSLEVTKIVMDE